jgi:hypothetical protein
MPQDVNAVDGLDPPDLEPPDLDSLDGGSPPEPPGPDRAGLRSRLPELLWLHSMGIVLYWVHDASPGCEKTYQLIDVTAPLAERLVRLARLPVLRSMTRRLLGVLDEVLG